jgi:hypothetical protein
MGAAMKTIERILTMAEALGITESLSIYRARGGWYVGFCASDRFGISGSVAESANTLAERLESILKTKIEEKASELKTLQDAIQEVPSEDA